MRPPWQGVLQLRCRRESSGEEEEAVEDGEVEELGLGRWSWRGVPLEWAVVEHPGRRGCTWRRALE